MQFTYVRTFILESFWLSLPLPYFFCRSIKSDAQRFIIINIWFNSLWAQKHCHSHINSKMGQKNKRSLLLYCMSMSLVCGFNSKVVCLVQLHWICNILSGAWSNGRVCRRKKPTKMLIFLYISLLLLRWQRYLCGRNDLLN